MQLIQAVLFLDLSMCISGGNGLTSLSSGTPALLSHVGFLLITLAAFAAFSAYLVRAVGSLFRNIILFVPGLYWLACLFDDPHAHEKAHGYVWTSQLRDHAIKTNATYWIDKCDELDARRFKIRLDQRELGNVILGALMLGIASWHPQLLGVEGGTALSVMSSYLPAGYSMFIGSLTSLVLICMILGAWFYPDRSPVIEHPVLYQELQSPEQPTYLKRFD